MAVLTIQTPVGAPLPTIGDERRRTVYFLSPVDGRMRSAVVPAPEGFDDDASPSCHQVVGRFVCPLCDGERMACRLCDEDGTVGEEALDEWMADHGTVLGDAALG